MRQEREAANTVKAMKLKDQTLAIQEGERQKQVKRRLQIPKYPGSVNNHDTSTYDYSF